MEFAMFQAAASRTIEQQATESDTIAYILASATEEMGEIAGTVREYFRTGKVDRAQLIDDLADAQWYLSAIAALFGLDLDEIAEYAVNKIERRARVTKIESEIARRIGRSE